MGCYGVLTFLRGIMNPNFRKNENVKNDVFGNLCEYHGVGYQKYYEKFSSKCKNSRLCKFKIENTFHSFCFLVTYKHIVGTPTQNY